MALSHPSPMIRYAVVGIGHIAQVAVLPAFKHARENSVLAAFVTGHPEKARRVSKEYQTIPIYRYDEYTKLLDSGAIDAVYIAVPNHLHYEFALKALARGIHVLCEKPFVLEEAQAKRLTSLARKNDARLMVAYRLHFEPANLKALDIARSGQLGALKYFNSSFSFVIDDPDNIRLQRHTGGGPIWDIGIYCINAARSLFQEEPIEVFAFEGVNDRNTFRQVPEIISVSLRFSAGRMANFVCSFGAEAMSDFDLVGSNGRIHLHGAYEYAAPRTLTTVIRDQETHERFKQLDQFAPELVYFSDSIISRRDPEPSGLEGWADVRVIRAILQSAQTGRAVRIRKQTSITRKTRVKPSQKMQKPKVKLPTLHGVNGPH